MAEAAGGGDSGAGGSEGGILPAIQAIKKDPRIGLVGAVQVKFYERPYNVQVSYVHINEHVNALYVHVSKRVHVCDNEQSPEHSAHMFAHILRRDNL